MGITTLYPQWAIIPHKPRKTLIMRITRRRLRQVLHQDQCLDQLLDTGKKEHMQVKHMNLAQAVTLHLEDSSRAEDNLGMVASLSKQTLLATRKEDTPNNQLQYNQVKRPCMASKMPQLEATNHPPQYTLHKVNSRQQQLSAI